MLCWFPYACTSIAEVAGFKADTDFSYYVLAIPAMLTKTSVCTDPIIYFYYNPQVMYYLQQLVLNIIVKGNPSK